MKRKRTFMVVSVLVLLVLLLGSFGCSQPASTPSPAPAPAPKPTATAAPTPKPTATTAAKFPTIIQGVQMPKSILLPGGGSPESTYTLMCKATELGIKKYWPGTATRVELGAVAGSVGLISRGEALTSVALVSPLVDAYLGKGTYKQANPDLRVWAVTPNVSILTTFTLGNSPIKDISELKDKRVGVGPAGSGTEILVQILFRRGYGFTYDDITKTGGLVFRGGWAEMAQGVASGNLDAGTIWSAHPDPDLLQLANAPRGAKILSWNEKALAGMEEEYIGSIRVTLPGGIYPKIPEMKNQPQALMTYFGRKDVPDDVVYNILVATFENDVATMRGMHPTLKAPDFIGTALANTNEKFTRIPIAPGAAKFWADVKKMGGY